MVNMFAALSYDTLYLSHTSAKDSILVSPLLKNIKSPKSGRFPLVSKWVVPPRGCTSTGSSSGQMLQRRGFISEKMESGMIVQQNTVFQLTMPVHHVK